MVLTEKTNEMRNDREKSSTGADQESEKLYFESMKHLTTLNTGSILLLVTMMEKLFKSPRWWGLIVGSLASFTVSIVCSVSSMLQSANYVKWEGRIQSVESAIKDLMYYIALITFVLGIVCLIVFTTKNLFQGLYP